MPSIPLRHKALLAIIMVLILLPLSSPSQATPSTNSLSFKTNHQTCPSSFIEAKLTDSLGLIPLDNRSEEEKAKARQEWEQRIREEKRRKQVEAAVVAVGGILALIVYAFLARRILQQFRSKATPNGIRRLSIVATPVAHIFLAFVLAAAFSFGESRDDREALAILYILQAILFVPSLTLLPLARSLYLWVRQGFEEDQRTDNNQPQKERTEK